jgi:hypothetical protein
MRRHADCTVIKGLTFFQRRFALDRQITRKPVQTRAI